MEQYKILFAPSLKEIVQEEGKTVLDAAREAGVYVDSQCNGKGKCGKCRVRVVEGKAGPFTDEEAEFISQPDRTLGFRLACMTSITGDLTVLVTQENILSADSAKKLFSGRSAVLNPAIKAYSLDLPREEGPQTAYLERIAGLLARALRPCGPRYRSPRASGARGGDEGSRGDDHGFCLDG